MVQQLARGVESEHGRSKDQRRTDRNLHSKDWITKLSNRESEKFWPEKFTDKTGFAKFLGGVAAYRSVLGPGLMARPLLECTAAVRGQTSVSGNVGRFELEHENPYEWIFREVSKGV